VSRSGSGSGPSSRGRLGALVLYDLGPGSAAGQGKAITAEEPFCVVEVHCTILYGSIQGSSSDQVVDGARGVHGL
jgi:hypothetical protein